MGSFQETDKHLGEQTSDVCIHYLGILLYLSKRMLGHIVFRLKHYVLKSDSEHTSRTLSVRSELIINSFPIIFLTQICKVIKNSNACCLLNR